MPNDDDDETQITGTMAGVHVEIVHGRPQLVLTIYDHEAGIVHELLLERGLARTLTKILGPNKLVEEFFRQGNGLQ